MEKPDYEIILHASPTTPNDPYFPQQTNLHDAINDVDVDAPEAWAYTTGSASSDSIVVAVADIGFTIHPDFEGNLWVNDKEIAGDDIDNDDNGCTDDIHGCDFFTDTGTFVGSNGSHGTRVAAVLGARGNNGQDITGVAWAVRMLLVNTGNLLAWFNYILNLRARVDVRVINFSVLPSLVCGEFPMADAAFKRLESEGILFVQAAGNHHSNIDEQDGGWPRCLGSSNHINVASHSRSSHSLASHSNYGPRTVDLAAPGHEVPIGVSEDGLSVSRDNGTSFAAPHVSGAAALVVELPSRSDDDRGAQHPARHRAPCSGIVGQGRQRRRAERGKRDIRGYDAGHSAAHVAHDGDRGRQGLRGRVAGARAVVAHDAGAWWCCVPGLRTAQAWSFLRR